MRTIDETDRRILEILQANARLANAEIARRVGMAPSAVLERIRKLEERGVIAAYRALVEPKQLGLGLLAFVFVRVEERPGEEAAGRAMAALPEVLEVHHIAGEDCYLAKVRAADAESLGLLLRERFGAIPAVRSTRTTIVLATLKEDFRLPIETPVDATSSAPDPVLDQEVLA
jgi:Lrp/AsnC family leucine-responsive transcriptional regulator